ncbi:hypothetical protein Tco_1551400, partial [Tanacetum coccineum]
MYYLQGEVLYRTQVVNNEVVKKVVIDVVNEVVNKVVIKVVNEVVNEVVVMDEVVGMWMVRILQKSKENGQNRTITDTGTEEHTKSRENAIKSQQWSTQVNL